MEKYKNISKLVLNDNFKSQFKLPITASELTINDKGWLYLSEAGYKSRLKGLNYKLIPKGPAKQLKTIKFQAYSLFIDDYFISEAYGECSLNPELNSLSEMQYVALLRTCKDLGIASELWDPRQVNKLRDLYFEKIYDPNSKRFIFKRKK